MSFIISAPSTERRSFKPVPAGTHVAICTMLVDVGMQPAFEVGKPPQHKIYVGFDVPGERISMTDADGNPTDGPAKIGSFYTLSLHEKAKLRAVLESWRGKAFSDADAKNFDVASILGKACMLSVAHRVNGDRTYANIMGVMALPKGVPAPTLEGAILMFPDANDPTALDRVPEFLRKKIDEQIRSTPAVARPAPARQTAAPQPVEEFADDVPF
jgi:hypothetical protein